MAEHGRWGYRKGCRCSRCRHAHADEARQGRRRRGEVLVYLPSEPLRRQVALRAAEGLGRPALARGMAARLGRPVSTMARRIDRLMAEGVIREDVADEFCVCLGLHLDVVYPRGDA